MIRPKFIIIVAMAILFAQLQCIAGCAGDPCDGNPRQAESAPPCHQHQDHGQDHGSGSCAHHLVISPATLPHAGHAGVADVSIAELPASTDALVPSHCGWSANATFEASPPPLRGSSIVVLRI